MTRITGGFFWAQDGAPIHLTESHSTVSHCVFFGRPRWWQVRLWYRAWRAWLNLPHSEPS